MPVLVTQYFDGVPGKCFVVVPVVAHLTLFRSERAFSGNNARRVAKNARLGEELEARKVCCPYDGAR